MDNLISYKKKYYVNILLFCHFTVFNNFCFISLGRIGVIDVADMVHCTLDAIDKNSILDKNRVAVVGGSHGGQYFIIL